jgi:hypothetical protein
LARVRKRPLILQSAVKAFIDGDTLKSRQITSRNKFHPKKKKFPPQLKIIPSTRNNKVAIFNLNQQHCTLTSPQKKTTKNIWQKEDEEEK